jgi:transposase
LAKYSIPTLPQPLYSPDLSPPDIFLFPKLKITLKGRRFQTVEDTIVNATNYLKAIPQTCFEQFFQKWKRWWKRCIAAQEDYFDGDTIQ